MNEKGRIGRKGEELVAQWLAGEGHYIIERNFRTGHLEIDIISIAGDGIHFVEVKSRKAPVQAEPQDNVDWLKKKHIATAARRFLAGKGLEFSNMEAWMDVATVTFYGDEGLVEYFPNAYTPIYV